MLRRLAREPLLHFILLGALVFVAHALLSWRDAAQAASTIVVDRDRLVEFLRNRTQLLDDAEAARAFDAMPASDRATLAREYVRDEALYREALQLGLDAQDYSIHRRLVQQMEYLLRATVDEQGALTDAAVAAYHAANLERYREPPRVTFAHVYVAPDAAGGDAAALARATRLRDSLNARRVPFHEAPAHGDRFLYHTNYVRRTAPEVAADFGPDLQQRLFALAPDPPVWQGPFRSAHGLHLVMLTEQLPQSDPPLAQIRARVERDALRARHDTLLQASVESVVAGYTVNLDPSLGVAD